MPRPRRHAGRVVLLLVLAVIVGCTSVPFPFGSKEEDLFDYGKRQPVGPIKVKADSSGLDLTPKHNGAARGRLLAKVDELVGQQRHAMARVWIARFPDVSLEVLRSVPPGQQPTPAMTAIASVYDELAQAESASSNWSEVIRSRHASPARFEAYDEARSRVTEYLQGGFPDQASGISLVPLARSLGPQLEIDALHLTGVVGLLNEQPQVAAKAFEEAAEKARRHNPHQAADLLLLLSDAHRRLQQHEQATAAWQQAVLLGAQLLDGPSPLCDPAFWERASYLRPVDQRWPQAVERQFLMLSGLPFDPGTQGPIDEELAGMALWACVGKWRLERDQPQAALVALKRAETLTGTPELQDGLRLLQAKAMSELGQSGAATALLVSLSHGENRQTAAAAESLLGSMKLQAGQTQLGFNLLSKGVDTDIEWPMRAEAEADLGLAYLMLGDETQGLRWLHSAQNRFHAQGRHDLLARSLYNEKQYLKHHQRKKDAAALAQRLRQVETAAVR